MVYGTLTEARKQLALHEVGLARGEVKAPVKITIQQLIEDWNRLVGDLKKKTFYVEELTYKFAERNINIKR